jgi:PAS domain S-box-containing protein
MDKPANSLPSTKPSVQEQAERLRTTLSSIGDAVIATDASGRVESLNRVAEALTGWSMAEAVGKPLEDVFRIIDERTGTTVETPVTRVLREGTVIGLASHTALIARDGTIRPIDDSAAPIRGDNGAITGVVLVFRDVTERRKADATIAEQVRLAEYGRDIGLALTRSGPLQKALTRCAEETVRHLDGAFARIWTLDESGDVLELQASAGMYTHTDGAHSRIPVGQFKIGQIARERRPHLTNAVIGDPRVPAQEWARREGMIAFAGYPLVVDDRLVGVLAMFARHRLSEATLRMMASVADEIALGIDRKRAWERLHRQSEWLRVTLASIGDAVIATDIEGRVTFLNAVAESLTGWTRADAAGEPLEDVFRIVNETTRRPVENPAARALREGTVVGLANHTVLIARDGTERTIDDSAAPIRDDDDAINGVVLIFRDVTERRTAERALEASEARKAAILQAGLDAIITIDHEGRILEFNPAAERIFGYPRDEAIGRSIDELIIPPSLREAHRRGLGHFRAGGEGTILGRRIEITAMRSGGAEFPAELALARLEAPGPPLFTAHVRDITERKKAEETLRESERRFRELADAMPQIVWTARPDGLVDYCNERGYEFTGRPEGENRDEGWKPVLHPDDARRSGDRWNESVKTGEPFQIEYRFWDRSRGEYRWFLGRALAVRDESGRVVKWYGSATDIDDQKRAEEALREADRRKDEFIAMLAHELRNPLAPILNALQVMKLAGEDARTAEPLREMMERQAHHMTRLVEDLLDVSRINSGKIELRKKSVDLVTLIRQVAEASRPFIEKRRHTLALSLPNGPMLLEADPTRLEQVLDNLLTNAAKYTDPGGSIGLTVVREGDAAVIRLRDTGIGIEPEMLPKIFDLFVQAEQRPDRAQGGLGIGLSLVRSLVEMHGGSVMVHSEGLGKGSEFVVRLPVSKPAVATANGDITDPKAGPSASSPRRHILVVDDNRDAANSLARLLTILCRQEVRVAYDGPSALEAAASFRPEVVLLDIGLPGMDGYEVARKLRARPELDGTLLVALTGWGQDEDRQRSKEAGFDRHLVKPVDPDALMRLLAEPHAPLVAQT